MLTTEAIEGALAQAPAVSIPPTFAVDVARRARLEAPRPSERARGPKAGLVIAALLIGLIAAGWLASGAPLAAMPLALLVLACGEAIVFAAWSLPDHASPRA